MPTMTTGAASAEQLRARLELRRSNAARPHVRADRKGTRAARLAAAVKETN